MPATTLDAPPAKLSDLIAEGAAWAPADLPLGEQDPTHRLVPACDGTHGHDAVEFAGYIGIDLMPFQAQGLVDDLGYVFVDVPDGDGGTVRVERWAAQETEEVIARRNGKTVRIVVLILFALFVLGERKILYTAHRDDTAADVFENVVAALKRTPKLWAEVVDKGPRYANGQRSIKLKSGAVVFFRTRGSDSGRGQGYQRLIFDEDQDLTEEELAALMPLVTGEPNAQLNYAGSAGDKDSKVQAKLRRSADRRERGLCYRGWHADADDDFDSVALIARTNPRVGRGLSWSFIAKERARLSRAAFGRERCGAATYPREEGDAWVIPEDRWRAATDEGSTRAPGSRLVFALEADPQLEAGTVGVAAHRTDGAVHIEVVDYQPGVLWMVARAKALQTKYPSAVVALDPKGPVGYLAKLLRDDGVVVTELEPLDLREAWTYFYTALMPAPDPEDPDKVVPRPTIFHRGGARLTQSLAAAETRKFLDRWTWRRAVAQEVNQGPLTAVTWAAWVLTKLDRQTATPTPRKAPASGARSSRSQNRGYRTAPRRGPAAADLKSTGF